MLAKLMKLYILESEKSGIMQFLEQIKDEFIEIFEDFGEFFSGIKEFLYDGAVEKFGEMPVTMAIIAFSALIIMLLFFKFVNK